MEQENQIVFQYPVLDIIAVILAFCAICVSLFSIYKSMQIANNTATTSDNLNVTYQEIYKIRLLLEEREKK